MLVKLKKKFKYKEPRILKPGEFHQFYFLKLVDLPDGKEYFVVIDQYGDKHLITTEYYKYYPLTIHTNYTCHIDKINCMGRIFLEPVHPFYKVGKIYAFTYEKVAKLEIEKISENQYYQMKGETGEFAYLPVKFKIIEDKMEPVFCKISKIKKAKIFLELCSLSNN